MACGPILSNIFFILFCCFLPLLLMTTIPALHEDDVRTCEATSECYFPFENMDPNTNDYAVLSPIRDCQNLTDSNTIKTYVPLEDSNFHIGFIDFWIDRGIYSVCTCSQEISETFCELGSLGNYTRKVGEIRVPAKAPLRRRDQVVCFNQQPCSFQLTEAYEDHDENDRAILTDHELCGEVSNPELAILGNVTKSETAHSQFIFDVNSYDIIEGTYTVCWCSGKDTVTACLNSTLSYVREFSNKIGEVIITPKPIMETIECNKGVECILNFTKEDYKQPQMTDMLLVSGRENCDRIKLSSFDVMSEPISPVDRYFPIYLPLDVPPGIYPACWCSQCGSVESELFVARVASVRVYPMGPTIQYGYTPCDYGQEYCVFELNGPYVDTSSGDMAMMMNATSSCGQLDDTTENSDMSIAQVIGPKTASAKFNFTVEDIFLAGLYKVCWCSGADKSLPCSSNPITTNQKNAFRFEIGEIRYMVSIARRISLSVLLIAAMIILE
eukprot:GHVL01019081.1.p1 GENE.GHVL01019081.1~~GHVL01019081.1.p1  ORF type:complete len:498 (+),score=46.29 GHVL01019081.1:89-1582(+)